MAQSQLFSAVFMNTFEKFIRKKKKKKKKNE